MSTRHKLNSANKHFCAMVAGLAGLLMGSRTWFVLAAIVIVAASVHSGDIRLRPTSPAAPVSVRSRADPHQVRAPPEGRAEI